jgi:integrase/recombinase XerD
MKTLKYQANLNKVWILFRFGFRKKSKSLDFLRHCFATHLLEAGTSVYHIQHLLGHSHPKTTSIYIHLTRKDVLQVRSPLDSLEGLHHD